MKTKLFSILLILGTFVSCKDVSNEIQLPDTTIDPYSDSIWVKVSNFDSNVYLRCIYANGKDIYAGTDEKIYYSDNNGISWTYASSINQHGLRSICGDKENVWGGQSLYGLYQSKDKCKTWTKINNGIPENELIYSLSISNNILYVGTYGSGLYRSINNGATFEKVFDCAPEGEPIWKISSEGSNVVIAIFRRGIFSSSDNGITWSDISFKDNSEFYPTGLKIFRNSIYVSNQPYVYKKSVFDNDWKICNNNLFLWSSFNGIESKGDTLVVATTYGISFSTDESKTWTNYDFSRKKDLNVQYDISCNDKFVFSTDQYNVWRTKLK